MSCPYQVLPGEDYLLDFDRCAKVRIVCDYGRGEAFIDAHNGQNCLLHVQMVPIDNQQGTAEYQTAGEGLGDKRWARSFCRKQSLLTSRVYYFKACGLAGLLFQGVDGGHP